MNKCLINNAVMYCKPGTFVRGLLDRYGFIEVKTTNITVL